jgi:hypothetical protein
VNHGNTKLWMAMWPGGVIKDDPDYMGKDGSIHMKFMKFGWGTGSADSCRSRVVGWIRQSAAGAEVSDGYGDRGFQARKVIFPTGGCW